MIKGSNGSKTRGQARPSSNDCPYCQAIPGVGTRDILRPASPFDQVIYEHKSAVVVPTVGMFIPGYLLVTTRRHIPNFAKLTSGQLNSIQKWLYGIVASLSLSFGPYLIFEHGSTVDVTTRPTGACISHAHFHLIPCSRSAKERIKGLLPFRPIQRLSSLLGSFDNNYALMGYDNSWNLAQVENLPSQWIRRRLAEEYSLDELWDWGVYAGHAELSTTIRLLKEDTVDPWQGIR
jgi:diadenosine tetraphosphate (Ap4A) HIT family hydrolase